MHTEVQLHVAEKILRCSSDEKLISTKLPCWSCIRLNSLCGKDFLALQCGIFEHEMPVYPAQINVVGSNFVFDGKPQHPNLKLRLLLGAQDENTQKVSELLLESKFLARKFSIRDLEGNLSKLKKIEKDLEKTKEFSWTKLLDSIKSLTTIDVTQSLLES